MSKNLYKKCQKRNLNFIKKYWLYYEKEYDTVDVQNIHSKNNAKI